MRTLSVLLLATIAAGCTSTPVAGVQDQAPRLVLMPLVNLSGRDLTTVPGLLWESASTQALLTRVARSQAWLPALPFDPDVIAGAQPGSPLGQLDYDPEAQELAFRETMSTADRDTLLELSDEPHWQNAIETLWLESQRSNVNVHQMLRASVADKLRRTGFVVADVGDEMPASDEAPTVSGNRESFLERVRAASLATHANAALSVAVDEWDWTEVFDRGEVTVSVTAVISNPADGTALWRRSTGPVICRVPDGLVVGGSVDLREAWPRYIVQLCDLLFD